MRYHVTKLGCWKRGGRLSFQCKPGAKQRFSNARAVYEAVHGEQPDDAVLDATCGDKDCFNPEHMRVRATLPAC